MSKPKRQQEREWRGRKAAQNPHGKVRSFDQIADEAGKDGDK
ncbi:DUF6254 family protein [Virgibacillus oceani]|uniref:Uncharacterized protein n=1 Tax=Virgibacillus oceani TaxID=1479511 RepID=A0A917M5A8_9BACI|nr:DUF6254 family protein [Virgibacillus oceani]GGG78338.1 hypothetical protein GCM10011398_24470 [Virgibacillus oceani]